MIAWGNVGDKSKRHFISLSTDKVVHTIVTRDFDHFLQLHFS